LSGIAADVGCQLSLLSDVYILSLMSAGYYHRDADCCCCFCCCRYYLLSLMSMRLVRCLLSELNAAGHTYVLEMPLLLSSDGIVADVELGQRPHIPDGISDSSRACKESE
jgi:hypothetical protein